MKKESWAVAMYQSGTHLVTRNDYANPYYYVYADKRYEVCEQLSDWLNNGIVPEWANGLKVADDYEFAVVGDEGIHITVIGPMVLPKNDNGNLNWREDDSDCAKKERTKLVTFLLQN